MKNIVFLALFLFSGQFLSAQTKYNLKNLDEIKWIEGLWERTNDRAGQKTTEFWEIMPSGEIKGYGLTTNPDTLNYERLALKMTNNELVYEVILKNSTKPVNFKITQLDKNGFKAENPENDFPKVIEYKKTDVGMTATISVPERAIDFLFKRK